MANREGYEWVTDEMFDQALLEIMDEDGPGALIQIVGVYELVREHYNNEVLTRLQIDRDDEAEEERADAESEPLYWSNEWGWVDKCMADLFTNEDKETLNLPIGGAWREYKNSLNGEAGWAIEEVGRGVATSEDIVVAEYTSEEEKK